MKLGSLFDGSGGFPLAARNVESKEYEMWGNGVALPCVEYIMRNIKDVADERIF